MVVVMAGGLLGFGAAVGAYFALDFGLLAALAIWVASGPLAATLAVALALLRPEVEAEGDDPS